MDNKRQRSLARCLSPGVNAPLSNIREITRFSFCLSTLCLFGAIFYYCPFQASCEIDNGEQSTQSCFEFNVNNSKSWLYIDRDNEPPRCFVQISDLQREHNGTYSCFFENALTLSRTLESEDKTSDMQKKMDAPHRLPHPLSSNHFRIPSSPVKHFTLTVLIWPSGILVSALMYINTDRTFFYVIYILAHLV